jgi:hypothetical protein
VVVAYLWDVGQWVVGGEQYACRDDLDSNGDDGDDGDDGGDDRECGQYGLSAASYQAASCVLVLAVAWRCRAAGALSGL